MITVFGDFNKIYEENNFTNVLIIFSASRALCNLSKNRQFFSPIFSGENIDPPFSGSVRRVEITKLIQSIGHNSIINFGNSYKGKFVTNNCAVFDF
jgi:hypothetical protein